MSFGLFLKSSFIENSPFPITAQITSDLKPSKGRTWILGLCSGRGVGWEQIFSQMKLITIPHRSLRGSGPQTAGHAPLWPAGRLRIVAAVDSPGREDPLLLSRPLATGVVTVIMQTLI